MSTPIVPELHRLMIPERSGVRCRVEELEAEAMEAAGNYRRPQAQSIVNGVTR